MNSSKNSKKCSKFRRKKASLDIENFIIVFYHTFECHKLFWKFEIVEFISWRAQAQMIYIKKKSNKKASLDIENFILKFWKKKIFFSTNLNVMNCFEKSSKPKRRSKIYRMVSWPSHYWHTGCSLFMDELRNQGLSFFS